LKNLRTQLLTLKKQIDSKTSNIETIRSNLKQSQVRMKLPAGDGIDLQSQDDNIIDQTVRELEEF
jgi:hypothetical protein